MNRIIIIWKEYININSFDKNMYDIIKRFRFRFRIFSKVESIRKQLFCVTTLQTVGDLTSAPGTETTFMDQ